MNFNQPFTAHRSLLRPALVALVALLVSAPVPLRAQDTYKADRDRAVKLFGESKYTEAVPILEKLMEQNPNDVVVLSSLGFSLFVQSSTIKDPAARQQARERARAILLRSKELGDDSNLTASALDALAVKDATDVPFSNMKEAEQEMRAGEADFTEGKLESALKHYQRAFELDPKLYEAPLYAGDMYFKRGFNTRDAAEKTRLLEQAGEWFARAVAVNENRETAHRYWGDALMAQDKRDAARDKFVEAIIAEPYYRGAYVGLTQWAERYGVSLAHPKIEVLTNVTPMKDNHMTITIDPKALGSTDGTAAWMMYGIARATWTTNNYARFRKQYPNEKDYRHSLAEEADALHMVVESVKQQTKDGKIKQLDPALAKLVQLNDAGLLEAYILFARTDEGIAQDYAEYRKANRDKLRRYWLEYVMAQ